MKNPSEQFMINFRWITPLLLAILTSIIGWQTLEIRNARRDAMAYTDRIVSLSQNSLHPNAISKQEFAGLKEEVITMRTELTEVRKEVNKVAMHLSSIRAVITKRIE